MKPRWAAVLFVSCLAAGIMPADVLQNVERLEREGKFKTAATTLTNALSEKSLSNARRKQLVFEADRLERIRRDYRLTEEALFDNLKESLKDFTAAEYEKWIAEGRFDSREIDGERRFMISSVSNLYFRYPELEERRLKPKDVRKTEAAILTAVRAIKGAAAAEKKPYVLPKRFNMTMTVTAKPDVAPDGEVIRTWMPIPRKYPFQNDFKIVSSTPKTRKVNSSDSPIRAAYFESTARAGKPTAFELVYEYTTYGVHFAIEPDAVKKANDKDRALKPFLQEAPHVKFTPEIRALSQQIIGDETNDFRKAKKFYDWIANQIKYSYATEYSTIRNISEYCRTKGYGDCGQEALLFITLCRLNGIPARWQAGWNTFPGRAGIHDWAEIYLEPHGWMPVDPYMGIWAMRYARTLSAEEKLEVRDFYFGGLDQWRMSANSDHSQELSPPKQSSRSDTVDFQRGELEWGDNNLYFDKYSYDLDIKELELLP